MAWSGKFATLFFGVAVLAGCNASPTFDLTGDEDTSNLANRHAQDGSGDDDGSQFSNVDASVPTIMPMDAGMQQTVDAGDLPTGRPDGSRPTVVDPPCGNGKLGDDEECDDGNDQSGDGCSNECTIEPGFSCPTEGSACEKCGNGIQESSEACDDGGYCDGGDDDGEFCIRDANCAGGGTCVPAGGDGCSADCKVQEEGYVCPAGNPCFKCGDRIVSNRETCDDGSQCIGGNNEGADCTDDADVCDGGTCGTVSGDGCSDDCSVIEQGFTCPTLVGGSCIECGNGTIESIPLPGGETRTEECDDGNTDGGDGCSPRCIVEANYSCPNEGQLCLRCGDGRKVTGEACDDGNFNDGDGCPSDCSAIDEGWTCPVEGDFCVRCGNSIVERAGVHRICVGGNNPGSDCSDDSGVCDGGTCQTERQCEGGNNPGTDCTDDAGVCDGGTCDVVADFEEACDDGNAQGGDGCSADCLTIDQDWVCNPPGSPCRNCGDGILQATEACDDGRQCEDGTPCTSDGMCTTGTCEPRDGDGCSATCLDIADFYDCSTPGESCQRCGDGVRLGDEVCDDGGTCNGGTANGDPCTSDAQCGGGVCEPVGGDGCSATCSRIESGYQCDDTLGELTTCTFCGDSVIESPEVCDDGNASGGDGCSADCRTVEDDYNCYTAGARCVRCGNGALQTGESCDDGGSCVGGTNAGDYCTSDAACDSGDCQPAGGDGCAADCNAIEDGWVCPVPGLQCGNCGDGVVQAVEACDDGGICNGGTAAGDPCTRDDQCGGGTCDAVDGDGCSDVCTTVDPFYDCSTPGVACERCGDGIRGGDELCDDGAVCVGGNNPGVDCTGDMGICDGGSCEPVGGDGCGRSCATLESGFQCVNDAGELTTCTRCGDSVIESPEVCDDGNASAGDGCNADCTAVEDEFNCYTAGTRCVRCGNGSLQQDEACDDGGICMGGTADGDRCDSDADCGGGDCQPVGGDGCSADCNTLEDGWVCPIPGFECGLCGDGIIQAVEVCDDGGACVGGDNPGDPCTSDATCIGGTCEAAGGDGCNETCTVVENNYTCSVPGQPCERCGDGIRAGDELCDDGGSCEGGDNPGDPCTSDSQCTNGGTCQPQSGDGCGAACATLENGFQCENDPDALTTCTRCGDSVIESPEVCDDGNASGGDGCNADCTAVEDDFNCYAAGTKCVRCGNGIRQQDEACDDGGVCNGGTGAGSFCTRDDQCGGGVCEPAGGDGCSADCNTVEDGWVCPVPGVECGFCGDGVVQELEACDDGGICNGGDTPGELCTSDAACGVGGTCEAMSGDGCTDTCTAVEENYDCPEPGMPCERCGDGLLRGDEACDDGGRCVGGANADAFCTSDDQCDSGVCDPVGGDGCSLDCGRVETGWQCTLASNALTTCTRCGDGVLESPEVCDDGNTSSGDGCRNDCAVVEDDYNCFTAGAPCALCGNGIRQQDEACDDGDAIGGDGCSADCLTVEDGWYCAAPGLDCSFCGDGVIDFPEACDDGGHCIETATGTDTGTRCRSDMECNTGETCQPIDGDGCPDTCLSITENYNCPAPGELCELCGDGTVDTNEACDDGNTVGGDGCSADCQMIEPNYDCYAAGAACVECGNGVLDQVCVGGANAGALCTVAGDCDSGVCDAGPEACDDLNTVSGDGCAGDCSMVEADYNCFVPGLPCVRCGNGTKDAGEACDEGASADDVGCADLCTTVEPGYDCRVPGLPCARCGDGVVTAGVEACDDGSECVGGNNPGTPCTGNPGICDGGTCQAVGGDGCAADCTDIEDYYDCSTAGQTCERCGDGVRRDPEACDDGGTCIGGANIGSPCTSDGECPDSVCAPSGGDGCSRDCGTVETGWDCNAPIDGLTTCTFCGDGTVEGSETCDDGRRCVGGSVPGTSCQADFQCGVGGSCQLSAGDGCDANCQLEDGYNCFVPGAPCVQCGDGVVSTGEACDEGIDRDDLGCTNLCTSIDTNFLCPFPGYACAECGNGQVESTTDEGGNPLALETCDDGNRTPDDGCSSTCQVEEGFDCDISIDVCVGGDDAGRTCSVDGDCAGAGTCESVANCVAASCGDGFEAGDEECDDGNDQSGDGCSVVCQLEDGYVCNQPGQPCTQTVCGDSVVEGGEQCDDGDASPGDGCDGSCQLEDGYVCPVSGQDCSMTDCGDGYVEGTEACDDPDTPGADGSGCDANCQLEPGFACTTGDLACNGGTNADNACSVQGDCPGGRCSPEGGSCEMTSCGDGLVEGLEECDDFNMSSNDGCSASCTVEDLYVCSGEPSDCQTLWSFVSIRAFNITEVNPPALHYDPDTRSFVGYKATQDKSIELCLDGTVLCDGCADGEIERTRPVDAGGGNLSFQAATYDPFSRSTLFLQGDGTLTQFPRGSHCIGGLDDGDECIADDGCDSGICERWIDTLSSPFVCSGGSNDGERVPADTFCDSGVTTSTTLTQACDANSVNVGESCSIDDDCTGGTCVEARTLYQERLFDTGSGALTNPTGMTVGEDGRLYVSDDGNGGADPIWYYDRDSGQVPGVNNTAFATTASGNFSEEFTEILGLFTVPGAGLVGTYSAITGQSDLQAMFYEDTTGLFEGSSTIPGLLFPDQAVTFGDTGDGQETASDGGSFIICQKSNGKPCQLFARTCETDLDCAAVAPGTQCDPLLRCSVSGDRCAIDADCGGGETCDQINRCLGGTNAGDACMDDSVCGGGTCTAVNFCNLPGGARDDRERVPSGDADYSVDVLANDILGQTACTDPTKKVVRLQDQDGTWISDRVCVGGGSAGADCSSDPNDCGTGSCESQGITVTTTLGGTATISDNGDLVSYNPGTIECGQQDSVAYAAWLGGEGDSRLIDEATLYVFIECVCGNGIVEPGEQCDCGDSGGNQNPDCDTINGTLPARCSDVCNINVVCGDAIIDPGEECDNGRQCVGGGEPAGTDCTADAALCNAGGSCQAVSGDGCSSACVLETVCGNGVVEGVEECEPVDTMGNPNPDCTSNCIERVCGDGTIDVGLSGRPDEQCDDGDNNSDTAADACRTNCTQPTCGDGVTDTGEECDGQADCDPTFCVVVSCGNGEIEGSEQCDDNNLVDGDGCDSTCRIEPECGNAILETGEECDDGNTLDGDGCRDTSGPLGCTLELCGDGVPDPDEACDYGASTPSACINAAQACTDSSDCGGDACVEVVCTSTCTVQPVCGDGRLDVGEQCDDGGSNAETADATCRTDCTDPGCGDGVVDSSEECDDGNDVNGDGCSDLCVNEWVCGNGTVDPGEECDDGSPDVAGDGCRPAGHEEGGCTFEVCGDGYNDPQEECDYNDPALPAGQVCTFSCTIQPVCGNGLPEGTEQCDEGAANAETPDADCRTDCTLPGCGDGVVDSTEECDDGNKTDGDGCTATCEIEVGVCGDGTVDPGEECDDGNVVSGDGCRGTDSTQEPCTTEVCGDGYTDPQEACDYNDTSLPEGQVCTVSCTIQPVCGNGLLEGSEACDEGDLNAETADAPCRTDCTRPGCGDGVVDSNEQCDDGNNVSGDGCDATCAIEVGVCGDGTLDPNEVCDDGNLESGDGCRGSDTPNPCTEEVCGDEINDPQEECDYNDPSLPEGQVCTLSCTIQPVCGNGLEETGEECDQGAANSDLADAACRTDCTLAGCGDGVVDMGEECDDGNNVPGDGCDASCMVEPDVCGDGNITGDEGCDDGNVDSGDGCRGTEQGVPVDRQCQPELCGDGYLDAGEECDDDNTVSGDGCSNTCVLETVCGNEIVEGAEECDDGGYTGDCDECSPTCQLNPAVCGNGIVEPGEECDDGPTEPDMCTPPVSGDGCDANCQRENFCGDGQVAGQEECDEGNANSDQPDATCRTDCTDAGCGDGIVDSGEECDDGNDVPDDRCSNACIDLRTCGDGIVDADLGEECDDGNNVSGDGCSSACLDETVECGDGIKHFTEQCDDGNNVSGDGCSATCMLEGDFCGDGIVGSAEDCDNGGQCVGGSNDGQACSGPAGCPSGTCEHQESNDCRKDCTAPFCGDGILDEQLGEQCDPPGGCSCDDNCQVTIC